VTTPNLVLTPALVTAYWVHMQKEFGFHIVPKSSSELMKAVAGILNLLSVQDQEVFMTRYVTTLHKTIYPPFEVSVESALWPLWKQVRVCAHECTHIVQGERDGWPTFDARYLTSSSFRAGYEAEAFGCDLEMEFWYTGQILDIAQRAAGLKAYACSAEDIHMAELMLRLRAEIVKQGAVETKAAQVAIAWLQAHA